MAASSGVDACASSVQLCCQVASQSQHSMVSRKRGHIEMWQRHRRIFFLMLAPGGNFTFTSACRLHNIAFTRCSADLTPEHRLQHARALSHGWHFDLWKSIRAGRIRSFHTNLHYNRVVDLGTTSWCSQNHKPDDLAEVESIDGTAGGAAESVSELHYCKVGFTTGPLRARTVSLHVVRHGMALDTSSGLNLAFRLLRLTAPTLHASLPSLTHVRLVRLSHVYCCTCFRPPLLDSNPGHGQTPCYRL